MNTLLATLRALVHEPASHQRDNAVTRLIMQAEADLDWEVLSGYLTQHGLMSESNAARLKLQHEAVRARSAWREPTSGVEMVWIFGGRFIPSKPQDKLFRTLPGFSMAVHPVTNAQWATFVEATGYQPHESHPKNTSYLRHWERISEPGDLLNSAVTCPAALLHHPVVYVSYIDALHYCAWAGLNLPTPSMWEKATRGADGRLYPWGDLSPHTTLANFASLDTVPVGSYPRTRTAYGCQDAVGNVSELCHPEEPDFPPEPDPTDVDARDPVWRSFSNFSKYSSKDALALYQWRRLRASLRNPRCGFRPVWIPTAQGEPS